MSLALQLTLTLVATVVLSQLLMPAARRLGRSLGLVDHPSWRRSQTEAVPCSGGLAIYAVGVVAALALWALAGPPFRSTSLIALGLSGLGIIVLGVLDDRFGLHAEKKLLGQILVVSLPMASGLTLQNVVLPGLGTIELGLLAGPITLFWYLGFINSLNLIDGLDGLASGISAIVLVALTLSVAGVDMVGALWTVALLGAVLGFLRGNLSRERIFLGDAGSMLLGLWLAGLALGLAGESPVAPGIAVVAMFVPILDTSTTILRRWRRRVSVFQPDAEHLHHRLLQLGTTSRRATICLWFVSIAAAATGGMLHGQPGAGIFALAAAAAAAIDLAYTLQRDRHPSVTSVLRYLVGLRTSLYEAHPTGRLAKVIEMPSYRKHRRSAPASGAASTPPTARGVQANVSSGRAAAAGGLSPSASESPATAASPIRPKVTAARDGGEDVVLALTDESS
jgi:UDP-GlcNAc:undecaprenyl-phosphate GlcNAc-1-phosphate transferase